MEDLTVHDAEQGSFVLCVRGTNAHRFAVTHWVYNGPTGDDDTGVVAYSPEPGAVDHSALQGRNGRVLDCDNDSIHDSAEAWVRYRNALARQRAQGAQHINA